jgi:UrcA family protein
MARQAMNPSSPTMQSPRRFDMSTPNTHRRNTRAALALLAAAVCLPLGVQAGEPVETRVVSYADLNLSTKAGLEAMYARLEAAAKDVCGEEPMLIELTRHKAYESCVDSTLAAAVSGVRSASLAALHASKRSASAG